MDRKLIPIGGAYGRIEFCDLFSVAKDMVHIKRYGASSVLSHLFSQAVVSGEAFRAEPRFRAGALEQLAEEYRLFACDQVPQPSEFRVVFAVVSDKVDALELPFFSRVNLRQACKRLQAFGYRTALAKIKVSEVRAKTEEISEPIVDGSENRCGAMGWGFRGLSGPKGAGSLMRSCRIPVSKCESEYMVNPTFRRSMEDANSDGSLDFLPPMTR